MVYLRLMSSITSVTTSSMTGVDTVKGRLGNFGSLLIPTFFAVASYFFLETKKVPY